MRLALGGLMVYLGKIGSFGITDIGGWVGAKAALKLVGVLKGMYCAGL